MKFIYFVGADGCGKTTLAKFAKEELCRRGERALLVWSRFNNYLSKPMLALARLTRHSYYETHEGIRFGYHDFKRAWYYKYPFIATQAVDVNLAHRLRLRTLQGQVDFLVFERSPWDTLADVILDTDCEALARNLWGRWMTAPVRNQGKVVWISRPESAILNSRPVMKHDRRLARKIQIYDKLAHLHGWVVLNNDRPLEIVKEELCSLF